MTNRIPDLLPDGRAIVGYDAVFGHPMVREDCERCDGTGRSFDPTNMDRVNVGPFAGQCPCCTGKGKVTRVVRPELPPVDTGSLVDPDAEIPEWMLGLD
jgi:hypothetical protein